MPIDITIPSPGESITEVVLGPWHKRSGEWVEKDETLVEIESDKVTLEVPAAEAGLLEVVAEEGAEMQVGEVIGRIDPAAARPDGDPGQETRSGGERSGDAGSADAAAPSADGSAAGANEVAVATASAAAGSTGPPRATSLARKIAADRGVDLAAVQGTGPSGRIRKADVVSVSGPAPVVAESGPGGARGTRREKMSKLRLRIAERLVAAQHQAAMLTTFNEADMSRVIALRGKYKESFREKYEVGLGFMSFFVKACVSALRAFPRINAYIVGDELEYHDYVDVSVAVGTERGLVVPVLRNAEAMSFAEIEAAIRDFAGRARDGKLTIDEMTGGTFTISNGGVYGSLNSTPILNPPQSAILGMHKIASRAVEDPEHPGQIVLRPMMYLALSYDHRVVDGAEAVGFLVHVKEMIEDPERMMIGI